MSRDPGTLSRPCGKPRRWTTMQCQSPRAKAAARYATKLNPSTVHSYSLRPRHLRSAALLQAAAIRRIGTVGARAFVPCAAPFRYQDQSLLAAATASGRLAPLPNRRGNFHGKCGPCCTSSTKAAKSRRVYGVRFDIKACRAFAPAPHVRVIFINGTMTRPSAASCSGRSSL